MKSSGEAEFILCSCPGDGAKGWVGSGRVQVEASSLIWTRTRCCCSLLCCGRFQQQRTELWWLKTGKKIEITFYMSHFFINNNNVFSTVRCKRTKYSILLCVILLTVQTEQSAVVEILDEAFELVTELTPRLHTQSTQSHTEGLYRR